MGLDKVRSVLIKGACVALAAGVTGGVALAQSPVIQGYHGLANGTAEVSGSPDTLAGVLTDVIVSNPEVLAQWKAMRAAMHEVDVAKGGYYPSVDVEGAVGYLSREHDDRGTYGTHYGRLQLTQMIFDGWYTSNEVSRLNHAAVVAYYQLLGKAQTVGLDATRSYLDVRRYRQLVELARNNYKAHKEVYDLIQQRVKAGKGTTANLEQVTGRRALAKSNLMTAGANLHDVLVRYQRVVGALPPQELQPVPDMDENLPISSSKAVERAISDNPAFHAAMENISEARSLKARTKSAFMPKLHLQAHTGRGNNNNFGDTRNESQVELVLSMNLFNGGSDSADKARAESLIGQARYDRDTECVNLRQTTLVAYNDIRETKQQLAVLRQHAVSSGRVLTAYRQQFQIGQRTLLDVLDIENEYFEARRAYINGQYDLKQAYARTQAAMGNLLVAADAQSGSMPSLSDVGGHTLDYDAKALCPNIGAQHFTFADLMNEQDEIPEPSKKPDVVMPGNTLFALNQYVLTSQARQNLRKVVDKINHTQNLQRIFIAGHADSTGTPAINKPLSEKRARSVARFLVNHGVDGSLIVTRGYGATRPIKSNDTAAGRRANRRVEITLENPDDQ